MRNLKILQYHRISDIGSASAQADKVLPVSTFVEHIEWLDKFGFTTVTFDDLRLCQLGELRLPRRPIIITFDGGHLDTFRYAFPVLQERGMKAVFFVLGDRSAHHRSMQSGAVPSASQLMDDKQIVELHEAGCEIGSLSMTYRKLTNLDPHSAWEEILRSRVNLEIILNAPVRCFAYPYGEANQTVRAMVVQAQYSYACVSEAASIWPSRDVYSIFRIPMDGTQRMSRVALRVLGIWPFRPWGMAVNRNGHPVTNQGDF
jgi:peptidoglycan/xylan/chitin deacetylase (PgdA/CDA1 family)